MEPREAKLIRAGKKIRGALDAELRTSSEELRARRASASSIRHHARRRPCDRRRWSWLDRAARIFVRSSWARSAIGAAVLALDAPPISFQVDFGRGARRRSPGTAGDVVEANAVVPTAVRFSEGSSIVLEQRRPAAGAGAESNGARVLIEKGAPTSRSRTARAQGEWRFEAGPVTVDVTGTRFRVDWNPEDLIVRHRSEGGLGDRRRRLPARPAHASAAATACGVVRRRRASWRRHESAAAPPVLRRGREEAEARRVRRARGGPTRSARGAVVRRRRDWRALVAAGHYAEACPRRRARRLEPRLPQRQRGRVAGAGRRRPPVGTRRRARSRR